MKDENSTNEVVDAIAAMQQRLSAVLQTRGYVKGVVEYVDTVKKVAYVRVADDDSSELLPLMPVHGFLPNIGEPVLMTLNGVDPSVLAPSLMVEGDMQSAAYVPGESGWRIAATGDVEFNNAKLRGELLTGSSNNYVRIWFDPNWGDNIIEFKRSGDPAEGARITRNDDTNQSTLMIRAPFTTYGSINNPGIWMYTPKNSSGAGGIDIYSPNGTRITSGGLTVGTPGVQFPVTGNAMKLFERNGNYTCAQNTWTSTNGWTSLYANQYSQSGVWKDVGTYSSGTFTHTIGGMTRVTITHKWVVNGTGAREWRMNFGGGVYVYLAGEAPSGTLNTTTHQFSNTYFHNFGYGDTFAMEVKQDSGANLNLTYAQFSLELV